MVRRISAEGLAKLQQWEGLRLEAYKDSAGIWTVGYGHTGLVRGQPIGQFTEITKEEAEKLLKNDLDGFERSVERLVKVPLTDGEHAALVSFQFNTGGLEGSTLLKKLNRGERESVPEEMARWNKITVKGKKVVSEGLINRRAKEISLWTSGKGQAPSSAPVTPSSAPIASKENIAFAAGIISTAVPAVSALDGSSPITYVVAGIIAVSFTVALVLFFRRRGV